MLRDSEGVGESERVNETCTCAPPMSQAPPPKTHPLFVSLRLSAQDRARLSLPALRHTLCPVSQSFVVLSFPAELSVHLYLCSMPQCKF